MIIQNNSIINNTSIIHSDTEHFILMLFTIILFTIIYIFITYNFINCLCNRVDNNDANDTADANYVADANYTADANDTTTLILMNDAANIQIGITSSVAESFPGTPYTPTNSPITPTDSPGTKSIGNLVSKNIFICPICLAEYNNDIIITLKCSHKYHLNCIDAWIVRNLNNNTNALCPICNTLISIK